MQHFFAPVIVLLSILTPFAQFGGGSGIVSDPYQIENIEQLNNIRYFPNAHFLLTFDLDFSQSTYSGTNSNYPKGWIPIGSIDTPFTGSFNGGAHTIKSLYINDKDLTRAGLFGNVKGALLKSFGLESCDISANSQTGGVVGYALEKTRICSVFVTGTIRGYNSIGGVAGILYGAEGISCSYSTATVAGNGSIGGIVGRTDDSNQDITPVIKNCYASGLVCGSDNVGGLIGYMARTILSYNYSVGVVSGVSGQGALTGFSLSSTVSNCFWNSEISGQMQGNEGTGLSGTLMMSTSTYTEISSNGLTFPWDFKGNPFNDTNNYDVWIISEGKSYPGLSVFNNHPVLTVIPHIDTVTGKDPLTFRFFASDAEGDQLQEINVVAGPDFGKVAVNDSVIFYYPDSTFTGTDEFVLQTGDINGKKSNQVKISVVYTVSFAGGDGSQENPYQIKTINQLNGIRHHLNKKFILMNDIDFAGTSFDSAKSVDFSGWEPIGIKNREFVGSFNGKGYSIKNLFVNRFENFHVGLFGFASRAKFDSINIIDCRINGGNLVGSLIGLCDSSMVSYCSVRGQIKGSGSNIGGMIGECRNNSSIYGCHTDVLIYGKKYIGGLIGRNVSTVKKCSSSGILQGEDYVGGIAGDNYNGAKIDSCNATDTIVAKGNFAGGIAGRCYSSVIENSYFSGNVTGINSIGGFAGECEGSASRIFNCYAESNVHGQNYVGGLIGNFGGVFSTASDSAHLSYCHAKGVTNGNKKVGGLIGQLTRSGIIYKCHSSGEVISDSGYAGGLIGCGINSGVTYPIVDSCYSLCTVRGTNNVGGLIGHCINSQLFNCYSNGIVIAQDTVGGLAGFANSGVTEIRNCYSKGPVNGNNLLGGLIGYNDMKVYESYTTGTVTGSGIKIGGFVGLNDEKVENCYATGNCVGKTYVGGFAGVNDARTLISKCFSVGKIQGERDLGGFAGHKYNDGIISNCFWDLEASGIDTSKGGTGKTTAEFRNVNTFTDKSTVGLTEPWDFMNNPYNDTATNDIWQYVDGEIYPRLREYIRVIVNTLKQNRQKKTADLIVSVSARNISICCNASNTKNVKVSIFDLKGRLVFSEQYNTVHQGKNIKLIPLGQMFLKTGLYIISVDSENLSKRLKINIFQ